MSHFLNTFTERQKLKLSVKESFNINRWYILAFDFLLKNMNNQYNSLKNLILVQTKIYIHTRLNNLVKSDTFLIIRYILNKLINHKMPCN